jgi:aspartate racemase
VTADREPVVGVLGGMGPEATLELMRRVIAATPATDDGDHIRLIVDNNPKVPSRIKALIEKTGADPMPVLVEMARGLVGAGADILAIPCNTAHFYLPAIRAAVAVPVLDMIGLSVRRIAGLRPRPVTVGMLGSPAVRLVGLFDRGLRGAGIAILYPEGPDDEAVLDVIRAVKAGGPSAVQIAAYDKAAANLARRGAEALLIACTELSVIPPPRGAALPIVDTLDELVAAIIDTVKGTPPRETPPPPGPMTAVG